MEALLRWVNRKHGRQKIIANCLDITAASVSTMLKSDKIPVDHIPRLNVLTGITLDLLVLPKWQHLTEKQKAKVDIVLISREIEVLESELKRAKNKL